MENERQEFLGPYPFTLVLRPGEYRSTLFNLHPDTFIFVVAMT